MTDVAAAATWRIAEGAAEALARGVHTDPFAVLGPHDTPEGRVIRAFLPGAVEVDVLRQDDGEPLAPLKRVSDAGLFEGLIPERSAYRLRITWPHAVQETEDPYSFG